MSKQDKKYTYDRFGMKGARVGQAVVDILSKEQPVYTAGEILDAYAPKFRDELEKTIQNNQDKFKSPFYIVVLTHKEMWAENVVRNWFIARQTPPHGLATVIDYPHHMKTLYMINSKKGDVKLLWTIPGLEDCKSIVRNKMQYDAQLVGWVEDCFAGKLDKDSYPS